jgi:hypothetical protein
MKKLSLAFLLSVLVTQVYAAPATPLAYQTSPYVPTTVGTSTPLPVSVYGGANATSGFVYTSNGPGVAATFQASSASPTSTIYLGTSASATNPQRNGDATTGFYSASTGNVSLSCGANTELNCGSVGIAIGTTVAAANALDVKGNLAVGYAGTTSGASNGIISLGSVGIGTSSPLVGLDVRGTQIDLNAVNGISYLASDSGANHSIAVGAAALTAQASSAAYDNTVLGFNGFNNGGLTTAAIQNTGLGSKVGQGVTSGNANTFLGYQAGNSNNATASVAIGADADFFLGSNDVVVGTFASANGSFGNNVILGYSAANGASSTPQNDVVIGYQVALGTSLTGTNDILIGTSSAIGPSVGSASNEIHIGGTGGDNIYVSGTGTQATSIPRIYGTVDMPNLAASSAGQTGTVCWSTGSGATAGRLTVDTTTTCLLSREDLKDIKGDITNALSIVNQLKPFWFTWKKDTPEYSGDKREQPGMGANQTASVDSRIAAFGEDGNPKGVRYQEMTAVLVAAIQEQQKEILATGVFPFHKCFFGLLVCPD